MPPPQISDPQALRSVRALAERAFSRTSGAPLIEGNRVRVLEDADGNYPVWLEALRTARGWICLENYIIEEDEVGSAFAEVLRDRAQAGVKVHLIRDWMGTRTGSSRGFWRRLAHSGVEIRCFNPPRFDSPFGWISRDHRKSIVVDGEIAFVTGLCISQRWRGDPSRGVPPWRDTGVEIVGPAVADVTSAFAQVWETMGPALGPPPGPPLGPPLLDGRDGTGSAASGPPEGEAAAGGVALRIVAGAPSTAGLFRMDQLVAAIARRSLWLTDAYFVGVSPYVQALRAAARDGVDVRLLIPRSTDLPFLRPLSRGGFRPLLEAGVRIFEWNGSMLHAKTAVVDGRWSRIGSSNLNVASFLSNYELDVAIDDEGVARSMEGMYERDLSNATEILLSRDRVVRVTSSPSARGAQGAAGRDRRGRPRRRRGFGGSGSGRKGSAAAAGAIRVANSVGAAMTNHRMLGPAEGRLLTTSGVLMAAVAALAMVWPRIIALPLAVIGLWQGIALVWRGFHVRRQPRTSQLSSAVDVTGAPTAPSRPSTTATTATSARPAD
jgi:cardiolipin synthase